MAPRPKRSKVETAFVQLLLDVLHRVNEVIRSADNYGPSKYLMDYQRNYLHPSLRPPRVTPSMYYFGDSRARDRDYARSSLLDRDWRWGDMQLGQEWLRTFQITRGRGDDGYPLRNWGTIQ